MPNSEVDSLACWITTLWELTIILDYICRSRDLIKNGTALPGWFENSEYQTPKSLKNYPLHIPHSSSSSLDGKSMILLKPIHSCCSVSFQNSKWTWLGVKCMRRFAFKVKTVNWFLYQKSGDNLWKMILNIFKEYGLDT